MHLRSRFPIAMHLRLLVASASVLLVLLCCCTASVDAAHHRIPMSKLHVSSLDAFGAGSGSRAAALAEVGSESVSVSVSESSGSSARHVSHSDDKRKLTSSMVVHKLHAGKQTYGHGAVMGAAVEFARDPTWARILLVLQPGEAAQVMAHLVAVNSDRTGSGVAAGKLMTFLENNPVLAAYGALEHLRMCTGSIKSPPSKCQDPLKSEWDIWLDPKAPSDVSKLIIAHGGTLTTVGQSLTKTSNFGWKQSDVNGSPTATEWLELFGQAIAMGRVGALTPRLDKAGATKLAATFFAAPSGLVLDTKSTYSTTEDLDALVKALQSKFGIHVLGVGSFSRTQINRLTTTKPVYFYHSHFGVLLEAQAGQLQNNDMVMFNGGSLLTPAGSRDAAPEVDPSAVDALRAVQQQYNLRVALYVQETACSAAAVAALVRLTNAEPQLLSGGFAYGNVNGRADSSVKGEGLGAQLPLYHAEKLQLKTQQDKEALQRAAEPIRKAMRK